MYGSIFEDDFVVINKLAYGPRLPITPLSISVNGIKKYVDWISLPYYRLFGYSSVQRNDVLAFNYTLTGDEPTDMQEEFIKRCVALPGDSLKIIAGKVYANNTLLKNNLTYNAYTVISEQALDTAALKRSGIICNGLPANGGTYFFIMTSSFADSLSKLAFIRSVAPDIFPKDYYNPSVYPNLAEFKWNYDYFGPLWVPKKGDSILLSKPNLVLYQRCIERYENETLTFKNDTVFISGKAIQYYHFKQDYYFMLGDNRHNSIDSRITGLIPGDHIIGKASFILFSLSSSRKFSTIK